MDYIDFKRLPSGMEGFFIAEGGEGVNIYFIGDNLKYDQENLEFYTQYGGSLVCEWDPDSEKWTNCAGGPFDKLSVPTSKISNILYSSSEIELGGFVVSGTEVIATGKDDLQDFEHEPLLDFSSVNDDEGFFMLLGEEGWLLVGIKPSKLLFPDQKELVKIKSDEPSFVFSREFAGGTTGGFSSQAFESYYPYTFIIGGSEEVVIDGKKFVPKMKYMSKQVFLENQ